MVKTVTLFVSLRVPPMLPVEMNGAISDGAVMGALEMESEIIMTRQLLSPFFQYAPNQSIGQS